MVIRWLLVVLDLRFISRVIVIERVFFFISFRKIFRVVIVRLELVSMGYGLF